MGRPKMSEFDKAKAAVRRTYADWQYKMGPEFRAERQAKSVQIMDTEAKMGRPQKPVFEFQREARERHNTAWVYYKRLCLAHEIEPDYEAVVQTKRGGNPGRRKNDDVLELKKYLRLQRRLLLEAAETPERVYNQQQAEHVAGRRPMTKLERITHFKRKIRECELQLQAKLAGKPRSEIIRYDLADLKNERRSLRMLLNNKNSEQTKRIRIADDVARERLDEINNKIHTMEAELNRLELHAAAGVMEIENPWPKEIQQALREAEKPMYNISVSVEPTRAFKNKQRGK